MSANRVPPTGQKLRGKSFAWAVFVRDVKTGGACLQPGHHPQGKIKTPWCFWLKSYEIVNISNSLRHSGAGGIKLGLFRFAVGFLNSTL